MCCFCNKKTCFCETHFTVSVLILKAHNDRPFWTRMVIVKCPELDCTENRQTVCAWFTAACLITAVEVRRLECVSWAGVQVVGAALLLWPSGESMPMLSWF